MEEKLCVFELRWTRKEERRRSREAASRQSDTVPDECESVFARSDSFWESDLQLRSAAAGE